MRHLEVQRGCDGGVNGQRNDGAAGEAELNPAGWHGSGRQGGVGGGGRGRVSGRWREGGASSDGMDEGNGSRQVGDGAAVNEQEGQVAEDGGVEAQVEAVRQQGGQDDNLRVGPQRIGREEAGCGGHELAGVPRAGRQVLVDGVHPRPVERYEDKAAKHGVLRGVVPARRHHLRQPLCDAGELQPRAAAVHRQR